MTSRTGGSPAGCPILETECLILRPFREDDLDDYFAVLEAPEVRRWLHLPVGLARGDAWQQMAGFLGQWALRGTGPWALEERSSGAFLGRAGLHHLERPDWLGVEVGWTLHPDHWGRGYATEAGAEAIRYAFQDLDLDQEKLRTLGDITRFVDFLFLEDPADDPESWEKAMVKAPLAAEMLDGAAAVLSDCAWDTDSVLAAVAEVGESLGLRLGKAQAPVRVAVTGRTVGPPLFETMAECMERAEVLRRIARARARL